jgi:hypothetical protein
MANKFEMSELDALKNFPMNSMLLPILRFLSFSSDISILNDTILEVCRRYSEIKGKDNTEIYKDAEKIMGKQNVFSEGAIEGRIKGAEDFYDKY